MLLLRWLACWLVCLVWPSALASHSRAHPVRCRRRVWRASLGNLVLGRDPRRPFVEAFADEQLLGFTRYYIIILEHAKKNIAGVLRALCHARGTRAAGIASAA